MAAMPAVIYWVAGLTANGGRMAVSIGELVAFVTLQQILFRPAQRLLTIGLDIQSSLELFGRIFEYLDLPIDVAEPERPVVPAHLRGEVRLHDVCFRYAGAERPTLDGIEVTVPVGRSLAVVGGTGSGKTTLSYLIPRLYDATSGSVTIDGVDVREMSFETLSAAVGVVSQESYLFHASVADNLRFAKPDATDEELVAAARVAHIHDYLMSLPEGYDTVVGERGYRFSGGEKQRLAIARAVLRDPPVLVLDEATSALDTQTERAVQQAIDAASAGRTTSAARTRSCSRWVAAMPRWCAGTPRWRPSERLAGPKPVGHQKTPGLFRSDLPRPSLVGFNRLPRAWNRWLRRLPSLWGSRPPGRSPARRVSHGRRWSRTRRCRTARRGNSRPRSGSAWESVALCPRRAGSTSGPRPPRRNAPRPADRNPSWL
jgi:ABC-type lipoprotein export system ATPase subunit